MKNFNNELVVHRNETFTIDKIVQNKDGSPYVVNKNLQNPYILITIASSKYQQTNRYVKNYWLNLNGTTPLPRFSSTNAVNLKNLYNPVGNKITNWPSTAIAVQNDNQTYSYYIATDGENLLYDADDAVYYIKDGNKIEYKYATIDEDDGTITWKNYSLRIIQAFSQEDTGEWVEQTYSYSMTLLSGQDTLSYLKAVADSNGIEYDVDITKVELYELLIANEITLPETFDITRPIATFDTVIPILSPTKLIVLSSLQGEL